MTVVRDTGTDFKAKPVDEVTLPGGATVRLRTPGVLLEIEMFKTFPDLAQYQGDPAKAAAALKLDVVTSYEQSVVIICHSCVEPRFSAEQYPAAPLVSVDELEPADFRFLANLCSERFTASRKGEAEAIVPLSRTPDNSGTCTTLRGVSDADQASG